MAASIATISCSRPDLYQNAKNNIYNLLNLIYAANLINPAAKGHSLWCVNGPVNAYAIQGNPEFKELMQQ